MGETPEHSINPNSNLSCQPFSEKTMNRNIAIQKGAPYRKLRLVACMQIILQGVTPLMLTLAPVAAVNAENKNSAVISQALAHKKRSSRLNILLRIILKPATLLLRERRWRLSPKITALVN
ncbi:hypothetical protein QNH14_14320 [Apirhabdus apintestini]|nr:hypothetical protein QNH14_14320 [Enterobacteriaceae bacterium CA-0114]